MHLLVFGSINLDLAVAVAEPPIAGQTVLGEGHSPAPGGKGANQAHAARLHGASVRLAGCVGDDGLAAPALALLQRAGVDLRGVARDAQVPTGLATVMRLPSGDNAIVVAPGANQRLRADAVPAALLADVPWLLLQMEVPVVQSMAMARRVKAQGGQVMLNLAPAQDMAGIEPALIDWLVLNRHELTQLCQTLGLVHGDAAGAAAAVATAWGCHTVVTLGDEGALACSPGATAPHHVSAPPTAVVDTTGAGDTFCGVLAAALMQGLGRADALRSACVAASLACELAGAQGAQPSRAQLDAALASLAKETRP